MSSPSLKNKTLTKNTLVVFVTISTDYCLVEKKCSFIRLILAFKYHCGQKSNQHAQISTMRLSLRLHHFDTMVETVCFFSWNLHV